MLNKFNIGARIYVLGAMQLLLMVIMGGVAISQMNKIGIELVDIAEEDIPLSNYVTQITEHQLEQSVLFERALFNGALMRQNVAGAERYFEETKQKLQSISVKIEREIVDTENFTAAAIDKVHSKVAAEKFRQVLASLKTIEKHFREITEQMNLVLSHISSVPIEELSDEAHHVEALEDQLKGETIALLTEIQDFTLKASLKAEADEQAGIRIIIVIFVTAAIIGAILPYIIGRSIVNPIKYLVERLREIAEGDGDLTVKLNDTATDESGDVARAFNRFLSVLRKLIGQANQQAANLSSAALQSQTVVERTVKDVERQLGETEMVAGAVAELTATTKDVAGSTRVAADLTETVKSAVAEGAQVAEDTRVIITQLSEQVSDASHVVQSLVTETNNIGSVLESIQGIAEQTNLLALNAAIEAARAGESGRGFAVVADEVRSLAQRTQTSTGDIQNLLGRLRSEADAAVMSMEKGNHSAKECLEKSAVTKETFSHASTSVDEITDLNMQIATAANQQAAVVEEVNRNLTNIKELAENSARDAHETETVNQHTNQQINALQKNLSAFTV